VCLVLAVASIWFVEPVAASFAAHRVSARRSRPHRPIKTAKAVADPGPTPVLVELFTSEGCASCPTADTLLARLQSEQPVPAADILALEEHVDYWDTPAWSDRFASSKFSARQNTYGDRLLLHSEYTPEMIVDGTKELEGTDVVRAFHLIAQAASTPKLALKLSAIVLDNGRLSGRVSVARSARRERKAYVYAAIVEPRVSTQVLGGENGGQTLNHVSVVREMRQIGSVARARLAPLKFSLNIPDDARSKDLRVVVFVQRAGQGAVLGAVSAAPAANAAPTMTTAMVLTGAE
jgi:hypothetical protein